MESYKHKFAKSVLAGWLREPGEILPPFSWRSNRGAPNYGVWEEYPFCIDENNRLLGNDPVWDELDWDTLNYLTEPVAGRFRDEPPTYEELIAVKLLPIVIFDIALQHKGQVCYGIEVVHRNDVSNLKLEYLRRINLSCGVYRVDADWILSRCDRPKQIVCERIL